MNGGSIVPWIYFSITHLRRRCRWQALLGGNDILLRGSKRMGIWSTRWESPLLGDRCRHRLRNRDVQAFWTAGLVCSPYFIADQGAHLRWRSTISSTAITSGGVVGIAMHLTWERSPRYKELRSDGVYNFSWLPRCDILDNPVVHLLDGRKSGFLVLVPVRW